MEEALRLYENVKEGKKKISYEQRERLESLVKGYNKYKECENHQKKALIALLFETNSYLNKLGVLERVLNKNNNVEHPLLLTISQILYAESDDFKLVEKGTFEQ